MDKQYFHLNLHAKFIPFPYFPKTDTIMNLGYILQSTFYVFTTRVF